LTTLGILDQNPTSSKVGPVLP